VWPQVQVLSDSGAPAAAVADRRGDTCGACAARSFGKVGHSSGCNVERVTRIGKKNPADSEAAGAEVWARRHSGAVVKRGQPLIVPRGNPADSEAGGLWRAGTWWKPAALIQPALRAHIPRV
jgi:hypothetical protein